MDGPLRYSREYEIRDLSIGSDRLADVRKFESQSLGTNMQTWS